MRTLIGYVVGCLVLTALVLVGVVLGGGAPRVELFLAIGIVVALGGLALRRIGDAVRPVHWPPTPRPVHQGDDHADPRLSALDAAVRRSGEDSMAYRSRLQPLLRQLAAQRLRRAHGVDMATQPDAARALLGDDVWPLLTLPTAEPVTTRQLDRVVTAIERIGAPS
jgi:hypothetical protein